MSRRMGLAAASLMLVAPIAAPIAAWAQDQATSTVGSWLVACVDAATETARCEMGQRVVDDAGTIQILAASISAAHEAPPTEIVFTTPLGVWLEPGALLAFPSGVSRPLQYDRCDPGGCRLRLPLDAELRTALSAGGFAELRFADRLKQPLAAPLSLEGFSDALAKVEADTAPPQPRGIGSWFRWFGG